MVSRGLRCFGTAAKQMFARKNEGMDLKKFDHIRIGGKHVKSTSSVFVPLIDDNGSGRVLLTKRSSQLRSHRGEICFPGGKAEPNESLEQTALRETEEEIGLHASDVDLWGRMQPVVNRQLTGGVTPVIGIIHNMDALENLKVNEHEVEMVVSMPIDELVKNVRYTRFINHKHNFRYVLPVFPAKDVKVHFRSEGCFLPPEIRIWGLSAIILDQAFTNVIPGYSSQLKVKFD